MANKISRKTRLKIYDFSIKLNREKGLGSCRITKIVNKKFKVKFCTGTIEKWINQDAVPFNPRPSEKLLSNLYHDRELSLKEIANRLKIGKTSVKRYLKRYGMKTRSSKEGQKLCLKKDGKFGGYIKDRLNKRQEQFIIGTLLGDGSLYLWGRYKNARLKIQHTEKDKEYVKFKHSILKNFVLGRIYREIKFNKKVKKDYSSLMFVTTTHPEFTTFHELFYRKRKKIVNDKILNRLTPFGLAIWIMDDGYYNKKGKFIALYTMNFTYKEHLMIQNWFKKKYGISPKIDYHKQSNKYYLRFNSLDTQKLVNVIRPFIIPSMRRKIGLNIQKAISPFFETCEIR